LNNECKHLNWSVDQAGHIGTCVECGRQVDYWNLVDEKPEVIREGKPGNSAPVVKLQEPGSPASEKTTNLRRSAYTSAERNALAAEAVRDGIATVSKRYGIPKATVHGWVDRRKAKEKRLTLREASLLPTGVINKPKEKAPPHSTTKAAIELPEPPPIPPPEIRSLIELETALELMEIAEAGAAYSSYIKGCVSMLKWVLKRP